MRKPSRTTIGHAADLPIGQNLTRHICAEIADLGNACLGLRKLGSSIRLQKNRHPIPPRRAFYTRMKKNNGHVSRRHPVVNYALAATEQMELYCEAHPGSPAAVRRPRLFVRGELWIALLGPSVEEGIVGIGSTVTAALRAFDAQYLAELRPTAKAIGHYRRTQSASSARENSVKLSVSLSPP